MKATDILPEGYSEICTVNLQEDKKTSLLVNLSAVIIAVLLAVPALFAVPVSYMFSMEKGIIDYMLRFVSLMVLIFVYLILHELVHGVAMKICGTKKVKYGFTGLYAFAGSEDFYDKKAYIFIALAPVVFWGIVIAVINLFVPLEWFWVVYFLQIINLSGAAGDLYVTIKFFRLPSDILVKDTGTMMTVYSKQ